MLPSYLHADTSVHRPLEVSNQPPVREEVAPRETLAILVNYFTHRKSRIYKKTLCTQKHSSLPHKSTMYKIVSEEFLILMAPVFPNTKVRSRSPCTRKYYCKNCLRICSLDPRLGLLPPLAYSHARTLLTRVTFEPCACGAGQRRCDTEL